MEIINEHKKTWQKIRDEAAESSAIIFVINAEQVAKKLERLLKTNEPKLSALEVYNAFGQDMSGFQTVCAYNTLLCYWKYYYLLKWKSFMTLWNEAEIQKLNPPKKFKKKKFHGYRRIKVH